MNQNLKIFSIGVAGGVVGIFLTGFLMFGFFAISDKLNRIDIYCQEGKTTEKSGIICELLEIKDRGETLKVSDIVSSPTEYENKILKDKTTSGKFLEVKVKIKNERKESVGISGITLIDKEGRKYENMWETTDWIDKNLQGGNVGAGLSRDFTQIFEVSKDTQNFKVKVMLWKSALVD
ncbi:DUF4352 domain-containing protein [Patescibacteria group bacterium]|nr:DUF4352 domain-containing protein [Patescibacteria group bacterium]MBU4481727.1 DUF4352 domain-containing protein [Patescibacteria group bacterium]